MKDVQALEAELASLAKRKDDLEEIELTVMERVESLEQVLATVESERAELAARVEALEAQRAEEGGTIEAQRTAAAADRAAIAEALPADLIELYERQRARYGLGAAALVRGVSLGSNVKLTESDLSDIRRAADDDVVLCPDSGAILVRGEDSGPLIRGEAPCARVEAGMGRQDGRVGPRERAAEERPGSAEQGGG